MMFLNQKWLKSVVVTSAMVISSSVLAKQAEVLENISPQEMLEIAKGWGSAEYNQESGHIYGRIDGTKYGISLGVCTPKNKESNRRCENITFKFGYNGFTKEQFDKINQFNEDYLFFKGYKDDGDAIFKHTITLEGGITKKNINVAFEKLKLFQKETEKFFAE